MIHLAVNMDGLIYPIAIALIALALVGLFLFWAWAKVISRARRSRIRRRIRALELQQAGQLDNSVRVWTALKSSGVRLLLVLPVVLLLSPKFPSGAEGLPDFLDSGPFSTQTKVLLSLLALTFAGLLAWELYVLRAAPPSPPSDAPTAAHCG